jgi:murein DD-endopeptidase MepM/ murein hydrolase activator NlpD
MTRPALYLRPSREPQHRPPARRRRSLLHLALLSLISVGVLCSLLTSSAFPFSVGNGAPITGLSLPGIGAAGSKQPVLVSQVLPSTVRRQDMNRALLAYAGQLTTDAEGAEEPVQAASAPALSYQLYTVAEGDTASAIAARFGISLQYLLAANSDLRDGEYLVVGQRLIVPPGNGILHDVRWGETLGDIAVRYGVGVDQILAWDANMIASPDQVVADQLVFVPNGTLPVAVIEEPTPVEVAPVIVSSPTEAPVAAAVAPPSSNGSLIWPVSGPISSYMDGSHPLGIDIDLYNNPYAPIAAATSGTVVFAGGDPCCSYGYYVIVISSDGIETVYAHFSSIAVSVGQTVSQGDMLGNAGCTGYCTGNHLHFEVIDNGTRVNPLSYLP